MSLCSHYRLTADKRLWYFAPTPKLPSAPSATSFIRKTLYDIAGLPQKTFGFLRGFGFLRKQWQPDELVAVIRNKELKFESGSRHEYSNSNYLLLGVILENVTGKPYCVVLRELTVNRLGLENTYYLNYSKNILIANGYDETLLHLGRRNLAGFRRSLETGLSLRVESYPLQKMLPSSSTRYSQNGL